MDWIGYLQTGPFLDHLAVIIKVSSSPYFKVHLRLPIWCEDLRIPPLPSFVKRKQYKLTNLTRKAQKWFLVPFLPSPARYGLYFVLHGNLIRFSPIAGERRIIVKESLPYYKC